MEPLIVCLSLGLGGGLYARGLPRFKGRLPRWRVASFAVGLLALAAALLLPLGESFALHMLQHLLLVMAAAPLVVLGEPLLVCLWAFDRARRRAVGRVVRRLLVLAKPAVAWPLHVAALWVWHLPALFEGTLRSASLHALEHAAFLGTGLLFWFALARLGPAPAVGYLFAAAIASSLLGIVIVFTPAPLYPSYPGAEDQVAAGVLMWVGGGAVYLIAIVAVFVRWLSPQPHQNEAAISA